MPLSAIAISSKGNAYSFISQTIHKQPFNYLLNSYYEKSIMLQSIRSQKLKQERYRINISIYIVYKQQNQKGIGGGKGYYEII